MKTSDRLIGMIRANIAESMAEARDGGLEFAPRSVDRYEGTKAVRGARVIPLDRIVADPNQPRKTFNEESLQRLAASLKSRGQLQPARVRWDEETERWVIVAGERRFRAAGLAGLSSLLCIEADRSLNEDELLVEQLTENCLRERFKPMKHGRIFKKLMEGQGWSLRQLADYLRISPTTVSIAISLLDLPETIQADVDAGRLAASTAYEISKIKDRAKQEDLATLARAGVLKRNEAREIVQGQAKPYRVTFKLPNGQVTVILKSGSGPEDVEAALSAAIQIMMAKQRNQEEAA